MERRAGGCIARAAGAVMDPRGSYANVVKPDIEPDWRSVFRSSAASYPRGVTSEGRFPTGASGGFSMSHHEEMREPEV